MRAGAIEVRLPDDDRAPAVGTRAPGRGHGRSRRTARPGSRADAVERLGSAARSGAAASCTGRPSEAHEWRLVTVRGRIDDVRKLGDRWRAELVVGSRSDRRGRPVRCRHPGRRRRRGPPRDGHRHRPPAVPDGDGPPVRDPAARAATCASTGQRPGQWHDIRGRRRWHGPRLGTGRFAGAGPARRRASSRRLPMPTSQTSRRSPVERSASAGSSATCCPTASRSTTAPRSARSCSKARRRDLLPLIEPGDAINVVGPHRVDGPWLDGRRRRSRRESCSRGDPVAAGIESRDGRERPRRAHRPCGRTGDRALSRHGPDPGSRLRASRASATLAAADGRFGGRDPAPTPPSAATPGRPDGRPTGRLRRRPGVPRRPRSARRAGPSGRAGRPTLGRRTIHARMTRLDARENAGLSSAEFRTCGTANRSERIGLAERGYPRRNLLGSPDRDP